MSDLLYRPDMPPYTRLVVSRAVAKLFPVPTSLQTIKIILTRQQAQQLVGEWLDPECPADVAAMAKGEN